MRRLQINVWIRKMESMWFSRILDLDFDSYDLYPPIKVPVVYSADGVYYTER